MDGRLQLPLSCDLFSLTHRPPAFPSLRPRGRGNILGDVQVCGARTVAMSCIHAAQVAPAQAFVTEAGPGVPTSVRVGRTASTRRNGEARAAVLCTGLPVAFGGSFFSSVLPAG